MNQLKFLTSFAIDLIWMLIMVIPLTLQSFYHQLTMKKKNVQGQLAFVSIL